MEGPPLLLDHYLGAMARTIVRRSMYGYFTFTRHSLTDLMSTYDLQVENFDSWKELLGMTNETRARKKAKAVLADMLELLKHELVQQENAFVIPVHKFGYLKITDVLKRWRMPPKRVRAWEVLDEGPKDYRVVLVLDSVHYKGGLWRDWFVKPCRDLERRIFVGKHQDKIWD